MKKEKLLRTFWFIFIVITAVVLIIITFSDLKIAKLDMGTLFVSLILLAFFAEYVDSSLGMGYGTTLTPLLIILGLDPLQIVPSVLMSEFVTGISAGALHHNLGNVDFKRGTQANKTMTILAACSILGTIAAVFLAVNLPVIYVKGYIGIMILLIGLFILLGNRFKWRFSYKKIIGLGTIAAFNKGISGGGYGPLVTGGQVLVGVPEKNAVGITSLAEGLVCLVGFIVYILISGFPAWNLAIPLTIGAMLSVPLAAWTVKILPANLLRKSIGYATLFLGILSLIKIIA